VNPATLSIIAATFPPRERGTAIGIWAGVSALALVSVGRIRALNEAGRLDAARTLEIPAGR
jgi:nitrate/nitrite transporter NarK